MKFEDLTPEQQEKAKACKSKEELSELARSIGYEPSNEELEAIAGGLCKSDCSLHGGQCIRDVNCLTKFTCPKDEPCITHCAKLSECSDYKAPIECTIFEFPDQP